MMPAEAIYILANYAYLLTMPEKVELRRHQMTSDIPDTYRGRLELLFYKNEWLMKDPMLLNRWSAGYWEFIVRVTGGLMIEKEGDMVFNRCPQCYQLARTPMAKQCRHCGRNWH